jgi:hypothetical protein
MMGAAWKCGVYPMKLNSEFIVRVAELDLSTRYHRPKRLDVGARCLELTPAQRKVLKQLLKNELKNRHPQDGEHDDQ